VDEKLRPRPIEAPADFEVAFRAHFAPVYRFIARRVRTDLAEDLAAEAFATAYRRGRRCRRRAALTREIRFASRGKRLIVTR
jgi:RNA polymerase sigma-70 factor (ECF subfamily)